MGLWSEKLRQSKTGLDINKDGVLIKCLVKDGKVTIPDDVTGVAADAFQGCENVKINPSSSSLIFKLWRSIRLEMHSILKKFEYDPHITEFGQTHPCLKVWNMKAEEIEKAISRAIETYKEKFPANDWKVVVIDADNINSICNEIDTMGRDNLVQEDSDSVKTFLDMPFLIHYPVQQLGANGNTINNLIQKEGFGILFIKNLNKENVSTLPHNFIYNLIKSHSFHHVRLSPYWEVIVEVGQGVKLDEPGDLGKVFNGNWYRGLTVEKYLEEMKIEGKLIEADKESNTEETTSKNMEINNKNDERQMETPSSPTIMKEIDWEERHFQICLALISRTDIDTHAQGFPESKNIEPSKIIQQADKMVEALKKHHEEKNHQ